MGAQRLRGSQSRLNFTGVINRGGKWNQDALDAHDLRAPAAPPFATRVVSCLLIALADAGTRGSVERNVLRPAAMVFRLIMPEHAANAREPHLALVSGQERKRRRANLPSVRQTAIQQLLRCRANEPRQVAPGGAPHFPLANAAFPHVGENASPSNLSPVRPGFCTPTAQIMKAGSRSCLASRKYGPNYWRS
jgi:hypothetical protein